MPDFRAEEFQPARLEQRSLEVICGDYVKGFCKHGDSCLRSHEICSLLEAGDDRKSLQISTQISYNVLSFEPRTLLHGQSRFDSDGPGILAAAGPRHDNDHEDIRDIKILPTTDEILSLVRPYMPYKDAKHHHLPRGQSRLLDILFRQFRYEHIEGIVDACYHAAQQLASTRSDTAIPDSTVQRDTPRGVRYSLFQDVHFEDVFFQDRKGIVIQMSYACPTFLRGSRVMHSSGHFEDGMLVALVGLNQQNSRISTIFFEVHLRQSTDAMKPKTGNNLRGRSLYLIASNMLPN